VVVCSKSTKASFTSTWLIATGSGPSLRTISWISPGVNSERSTAISSSGIPLRSKPGAPSATNSPIELGHVGMEHELAGEREPHFEDAALALPEYHGVGEVAWLELGSGRVVVEEVRVQVK